MPPMRSGSQEVVAILCSDIHLSHKPPAARSSEPNWYEAMKRPLIQLEELRRKHQCIILCAGDVFDHWKAPPELINFALEHLPTMIAIPGQHDLPYHGAEQIKKSAWWTLKECGKIQGHGWHNTPIMGSSLWVECFPWGKEVTPCRMRGREKADIHIAITHQYLWMFDQTKYTGAPEKSRLERNHGSRFPGFDVVVVGDNHIPWSSRNEDGQSVFNPGSLIKRRIDERKRPSTVGLLMSDGCVESYYLDTAQDKWTNTTVEESPDVDMSDFIETLRKTRAVGLDFVKMMEDALSNLSDLSPQVEMIIRKAMDDA